MFSKSRILLAGAVSVLALIACSSNETGPAPSQEAAAATVNGAPVRESLVRLMLKQRSDLGREASAEARKAFVDRLAMQLLISQEAIKKGLDKTPDVVDQIELMRQSVLIDAFIKDHLKNNPVSDAMLNTEYEKMKAQAAGTEYKARHILVEKETEAKDVIAGLKKNPKSFDSLAKQKSKDSGSKAKGGELGWFDPRRMVPEFGAAVAKLAKGEFTAEPVKTQFGYHVILLEDSRAAAVQPLEEVKPALSQQLQEQQLKKLFDEMKAQAKIEITQAPAPAAAAEAKPPQEPKPAETTKK
jgi:peptidyl-prolyl cis-trans isomerase C